MLKKRLLSRAAVCEQRQTENYSIDVLLDAVSANMVK